MRHGYGRQLVRAQLAFAIATGPALLVLHAARPSFSGGLAPLPLWHVPYLLLAAGLYLVGLAWMLEIARDTE